MKRILIDCRFAIKNVGIGRYTRGLIAPFVCNTTDYYILLLNAEDSGDWLPNCDNYKVVYTNVRHYSVLEQLYLPYVAIKHRVQHYFALHFNAPVFTHATTTIVVHDLILHWYPNTQSLIKRLVYKLLLFCSVQRAKTIIAVSKRTQSDLQNVYGKRIVKKIQYLTEGIEDNFGTIAREKAESIVRTIVPYETYLLYVGNAKQHKNVTTLLEGFIHANLQNTGLVLVCNEPNLQQQYSTYNNIIFVSNITDIELQALYAVAHRFITASKYEGFCLPIIEARSCGTPILAANSPAITELADTIHDTELFEPTIEGVATVLLQTHSKQFATSKKGLISWSAIVKQLASYNVFYG